MLLDKGAVVEMPPHLQAVNLFELLSHTEERCIASASAAPSGSESVLEGAAILDTSDLR